MEETSSVVQAAETVGETFAEQTNLFFHWFKDLLTWENLFKIAGTLLFILIFWIIYKLITRGIKKVPASKTTPHRQQILLRLVRYVFYFLLIVEVLNLFGVKLSAIWGAAGIAGVAIGFAAQTSISNLISGLFVITEGSLKIGDTIIVDGTTGVVDAINLLSVRVHTYDNQMVRIPNSTIINSNLINNSYHKKRRMTLSISIAYKTDMQTALDALKKAPDLCPTLEKDPAPAVWFDGFGDSGIKMTMAGWFKPENFIQAKNEFYIAMKKVFDEAGIEIPYSHLDVDVKTFPAK